MEKYKQIMQEIQKKIKTGEYSAGSRLPSLKKSAKLFGCAEETVVKAYRELVQMHVIYVKRNSGHYVAKLNEAESKYSKQVNLASGNVQIENFPIIESQTNLVQAIEAYRNQSLNFELRGVRSLLTTLCNHLKEYNIFVSEEQIFMSQGILQMFSLLSQSEYLSGQYILVENPTYLFLLEMLREKNLPIIGINRTLQGFDLAQLEEIFQTGKIRFFYVTPYNHNPLGTNLSRSQIQGIAALAKKYHVVVIENDYFLEGSIYPRRETIFEYLREQCFYLSSYTKTFPFLRTGFMLVPKRYIKEWEQTIAQENLFGYVTPSLLSQATLEVMIQNETLNKFKKEMSKKINDKRQILTDVTKKWDRTIAELIDGKAGYYAVILFNHKIHLQQLIDELAKRNILVGRMNNRFVDLNHPYVHSVRISLSFIEKEEIARVFQEIYEVAVGMR